ncbi:MOSC and FAD-binding oxidoreductase domain-containing protein [Kutzneria sp. NPDC051319]|uniref:MOSC and FAD-binding oxidoreductase domain-containing protein n=1 Tax=Kutzneria sp. NPDC051319 TaxID=3155047 RepID=UPI00343464DD
MARLLSLNVGMPKDVPWQGRTVHTGIFKHPVEGPRMARTLNVDGDGQGDLGGHGGEQRAVLVYQQQSYDYWRDELGRDDLEYGNFGENFTVDGLLDDEVHIGDRYRIGNAEFEVTQPRVTCFRVGMRLNEPEIPSLLVARHRPGFYLRVIREGEVRAGDDIVRTAVGRHEMNVADIDALLYLPNRDVVQLRKAVDIPALSPGWQSSFRDLLEPKASPVTTGWPGFRPLRVTKIVPESTTIASVHLSTPDGSALPTPLPGQFLTVRADSQVRSYSLSAASEDGYRISVKRDGAVSTFLHTKIREGDTLDVAAPRGDFTLVDSDSPVVLLSAGVGITPVLAMLRALKGSTREVWWLHTARSAADHAFADEVRQLLGDLPEAHEHVYYTSEGHRLNADALQALDLPTNASAYMCGPAGFMDDMTLALKELGITDVHSELFGALPAINPGIVGAVTKTPHQPEGPVGTGPRITFARSGITVPWRRDFENLLELAEACDVPTRWACRTGVCHTCMTPVLSGDVRYQPDPLEPPEPGQALVCCSRPADDLVLDL